MINRILYSFINLSVGLRVMISLPIDFVSAYVLQKVYSTLLGRTNELFKKRLPQLISLTILLLAIQLIGHHLIITHSPYYFRGMQK